MPRQHDPLRLLLRNVPAGQCHFWGGWGSWDVYRPLAVWGRSRPIFPLTRAGQHGILFGCCMRRAWTMKKLRIYLDTSVVNFVFADDAPDFQQVRTDFFQHTATGGVL